MKDNGSPASDTTVEITFGNRMLASAVVNASDTVTRASVGALPLYDIIFVNFSAKLTV